MASIADDVLEAALARLQADPPIIAAPATSIRRSHRVPVAREDAPRIHLVDGDDAPDPTNGCSTRRTANLTVSLFVRDDGGFHAADPLKLAVMARLKPDADGFSAYPHAAVLKPGRIRYVDEIADGDAVQIDMTFSFRYTAADWTLDVEG